MSAMYNSGRQAFLAGDAAWDTDTFKLVFVDATYTFSAADANLSDILAGERVATSPALASKTVTAGTADAADVTTSAVTGDIIKGYAVFKDTGTESTSTLICYVDKDTDGTTPISFTPNGSALVVTFDAAGIFTL